MFIPGQIVDRYSSTTGFVHETNISREKGYLDLGEFSQDIQTFSVIAKLLRIGEGHLIPWHFPFRSSQDA